jgi:hypothetical protein
MAGFFANENAYLLYLSSVISGGLCNGHACAPLGNDNWYLYWFGENPGYAPHYPYPFYDITSGCNNNDVTAFYGLGYYCAGSGWDAVTGWGSVYMFQLAWAINTYQAGDFGAPVVSFSGPATNVWYNSDQSVNWTITDTETDGLPVTGVAGFSQAWDFDPGDNFSEATPGSGSSFYSGPQYPNATSGCLDFTGSFCAGSVGQGWHYVYVRPWDNTGFTTDYVYGPLGYDTFPPVTKDHLSGTFNGSVWTTPVKNTLSATDASPGSGVASTVYQIDSGSVLNYVSPFTIGTTGSLKVYFHSTDHAGNVESTHTVLIHIEAPTTTTLTSSINPSSYHQSVTFTAKVAGTFGATPTGSVTFKNGAVTLGSVALAGGVAKFTTSGLTVGSHNITASYNGSGKNLASTSAALTQTVNKAHTSTTLASSLNPSHRGNPVTFTATVTGAFGGSASGSVKFKDGTTVIGTGTVNTTTHKATFTTSTLAVGTHSITAAYQGSVSFLTSTSAVLKQVVNP